MLHFLPVVMQLLRGETRDRIPVLWTPNSMLFIIMLPFKVLRGCESLWLIMYINYHCHIFLKNHRFSNKDNIYPSTLLQFTSQTCSQNIKLPPWEDTQGLLLRINRLLCFSSFKHICWALTMCQEWMQALSLLKVTTPIKTLSLWHFPDSLPGTVSCLPNTKFKTNIIPQDFK